MCDDVFPVHYLYLQNNTTHAVFNIIKNIAQIHLHMHTFEFT